MCDPGQSLKWPLGLTLDLRLADELKKSWQIVHHEAATFPALRLCGAKKNTDSGSCCFFFSGEKRRGIIGAKVWQEGPFQELIWKNNLQIFVIRDSCLVDHLIWTETSSRKLKLNPATRMINTHLIKPMAIRRQLGLDKTKDGLGCCSGFCACKTEAERDTSQVFVKSNLLRHGISVGFLYVSGAKLQETARDSASVKHRLLFSCNAAQRSRTQQNAAECSRTATVTVNN